MIAFAITFAPMTAKGPDFSQAPTLQLILTIGTVAFNLMMPVLAGYIAYSVTGKAGLVPGFIGGFLSGEVKAGFLGALLAGLLAGYVVELIKKIPVSKYLRPIMPTLIIPVLSSSIVGFFMLKVMDVPIAHLMTAASSFLRTMSVATSIMPALLLRGMIAFDMGGPRSEE